MAKKRIRALAGLSIEQLRAFARAGAEATLARLRHEIRIIERTFPELSSSRGRSKVVKAASKRANRLSAEARKAVSVRMKKYWAERRKAKTAAARKA